MNVAPGAYPIEARAGEIERLRVQAEVMAFDAAVMLNRIEIGAGWHCLDLGCGAGGICDLLSSRAGPTGRVTGLDADPSLLAAARGWAADLGLDNVAFVEGDAYATGLSPATFDLVHVRFVASTASRVDALLAEALALVRPGGVLAFQEPDIETLNCYPAHPAWDQLRRALADVFTASGGDVHLAQRLYQLMRSAGLTALQYRPFVIGVTRRDPFADYLPQTIESVRRTLLGLGMIDAEELDEAVAGCRAHLADPDTIWTSYLIAQVWGRKPD